MDVIKKMNGDTMEVFLKGQMDTVTAPQLESELAGCLEGVKELVLDFSDLAYVSSAGLRVLLTMHKLMSTQGCMKVRHVNESIKEVFEITGFSYVLNIE